MHRAFQVQICSRGGRRSHTRSFCYWLLLLPFWLAYIIGVEGVRSRAATFRCGPSTTRLSSIIVGREDQPRDKDQGNRIDSYPVVEDVSEEMITQLHE